MSNLWGKLLCAMFGHRRGRKISGPIGAMVNGQVSTVRNMNFYECPRCGATWTRKVKVKP